MSKYRDTVAAFRSPRLGGSDFTDAQKADYPEVVALLQGEKNDKGQWDPSPCTISLFVNEGRLTACIKPKHDNLIAFATISDCESLLEALELFFCKVELDWRVPTKRK